MKYAWIEKNKLRWPVYVQCRVSGVSASGYRQHLARRKKILTRRHLSETALVVEIRAVYAAARGAYGWPRVWRQLKAQGMTCRRTRFKHCVDELQKKKNRSKSSVRAKVEHPFRILKRIFGFGFDKVRYRGLAKNHHRLCACFALVNLYLHRKRLAVLG